APPPVEWLKFLGEVFPDDQPSIDCLQEWFGYLVTSDTSQQKILGLLGATRGGKGTVTRVIQRLVGDRGYVAPRIDSFGSQFGLAGMIGKSVAVIPDARVGAKTDRAALTERLLSISGEDTQTVPRKFLGDWVGRLGVRLVYVSNVLP